MLSADDKVRIRQEEEYRSEVREELHEQRGDRPAKARFWKILNSAFGLWCLSSLLLGGLSFVYKNYSDSREARSKLTESRRRLNLEFSARVYRAYSHLDLWKGNIEVVSKNPPRFVHLGASQFLDNIFTTDTGKPFDISTLPEYRSRSFLSLLIELDRLSDPSEQKFIEDARDGYNELFTRGNSDATNDPDYRKRDQKDQLEATSAAISEAKEVFKSKFRNPYWTSSVFSIATEAGTAKN